MSFFEYSSAKNRYITRFASERSEQSDLNGFSVLVWKEKIVLEAMYAQSAKQFEGDVQVVVVKWLEAEGFTQIHSQKLKDGEMNVHGVNPVNQSLQHLKLIFLDVCIYVLVKKVSKS